MLSTIDLPCLPHTERRRISATCSQNLHQRGTTALVRPARLELALLDPQVARTAIARPTAGCRRPLVAVDGAANYDCVGDL